MQNNKIQTKSYIGTEFFLLIMLSFYIWFAFAKIYCFYSKLPLLFNLVREALTLTFFSIAVLSYLEKGAGIKTKECSLLKPLLCVFLISLMYVFVDVRRGKSIATSISAYRDYIYPFFVLFIGYRIASLKYFEINLFIRFCAYAFGIILLYSIYQHFFFTSEKYIELGMIDNLEKEGHIYRSYFTDKNILFVRVFGIFGSSLTMAFFCVYSFFNSYLGYKIDGKKYKLIYLFLMCLSILAMSFTYTRTSFVALIFSLIYIKCLKSRKSLLFLLFLLPLFAVILYKIIFLTPDLTRSSFGHLQAYLSAYKYFIKNPVGYGVSFIGIGEDYDNGLDGNFIAVLLNLGVVGFLSHLYIYFYMYKNVFSINKRNDIGIKYLNISKIIKASIVVLVCYSLAIYIQSSISLWLFHIWLGALFGYLLKSKTYLNTAQIKKSSELEFCSRYDKDSLKR